MLDELVVINFPRKQNTQTFSSLAWQQGLAWQTCLRQVLLTQRATVAPTAFEAGLERYEAEQAYRFLLETICGLHSPLLGETEVLGQFREFCFATRFPSNAWGQFLRQLTTDLLTDAKRIRQQHLQNLGSQSYGSLARHEFKGFASVAVLGAGQLAQEILPWLRDCAEVRVFARNLPRAQAALNALPKPILNLTLTSLEAEPCPWASTWASSPADAECGLIVAAPLSAVTIKTWVERQGTPFTKTLDLRGESAHDPLQLPGAVRSLEALFASLQADQERSAQRARNAQAAIAQLAQRQSRQLQCRPYGWEDLCA
jgi:glutamyl-tRNA reductase